MFLLPLELLVTLALWALLLSTMLLPFSLDAHDPGSRARAGTLHTAHGAVSTPVRRGRADNGEYADAELHTPKREPR